MYILALVIMIATGETVLMSYSPDDQVKLFGTKPECQKMLAKKFDELVKSDPSTNFMFACVTPEQFEATRKRLEERTKKTLYL